MTQVVAGKFFAYMWPMHKARPKLVSNFPTAMPSISRAHNIPFLKEGKITIGRCPRAMAAAAAAWLLLQYLVRRMDKAVEEPCGILGERGHLSGIDMFLKHTI